MSENEASNWETVDELPAAEEAPELPAGAAPPMAAAYQPAHKQLYQFLWGGIAVLFGCLLRFNNHADGWDSGHYDATLRGPVGFLTLSGSIAAFSALLVIGAQWYSIKFRRLLLGPVCVMALVCLWSWYCVVPAFGADNLGGEGGGSWFQVFYDAAYFKDVWNHVGPGHLFILCGSTYVVLTFGRAMFGLKKPKAAAGAGAKAKGKPRRR